MKYIFIFFSCFLSACASNLTEEKPVPARLDISLETELSVAYFGEDVELYHRINIDVLEGMVLLTGNMQDEASKQKALKLAKEMYGVHQLVDGLTVGPSRTLTRFLQDKSAGASIYSRLLFEKDLPSTNFLVTVHEGIAYLIGKAKNAEERTQVINIARKTEGVDLVKSYIMLGIE